MKKHLLKYTLLLGSLLIGLISQAQEPTIGLRFSDENTSEGYTLFSPETNQSVYLINNCGEKINEWTFNERPGATCYLLENGTLLRAGKNSLEIRSWNNDLLWSYEMDANNFIQHHDIEPLPNGNILCLLREIYTDAELIALGKDPLNVATEVKLDTLIELQPIGTDDAIVVWEWKFIDHIIQDFDNTKPNYGVVSEHPELVDLNFIDTSIANQDSDYTHVNGIDYNSNLDQIILSARHLNEIYIIDHSTTTSEAAGHSGGNSNLGGDILWRWGNPQVYKQGSSTDQKLFKQHDSKWVESGYLDEGKISVFNNGGDGTNTFSSVLLITPEIINGGYTKENNIFNPQNFEWSWNGSFLGNTMNEVKKSGAHSLPNGNFIICETSLGQVSEITKSGEHLWTYRNPTGSEQFNQFEEPILYTNGIFRAEKYPSNFVGFLGIDLTPQGIIEDQNSISDTCITLGLNNSEVDNPVSVLNPIKNGVLQFNKTNIHFDTILIKDINGKLVLEYNQFYGNNLPINLNSGLYFLILQNNGSYEYKKIIVL